MSLADFINRKLKGFFPNIINTGLCLKPQLYTSLKPCLFMKVLVLVCTSDTLPPNGQTGQSRAVGRSENLEGAKKWCYGNNLPPLIGIGLNDLPKNWPPCPFHVYSLAEALEISLKSCDILLIFSPYSTMI